MSTNNDKINDEEIIIDDLDLSKNSNNYSTENNIKNDGVQNELIKNSKESQIGEVSVDDVLLDIEFPLDEESKRKLQKKDLINVNEQYDVELDTHEENIPITSEVFKNEEFAENVSIKFPKDIIKETGNNNRKIPLKKPIIVDEPSQTTYSPKIEPQTVCKSDNPNVNDITPITPVEAVEAVEEDLKNSKNNVKEDSLAEMEKDLKIEEKIDDTAKIDIKKEEILDHNIEEDNIPIDNSSTESIINEQNETIDNDYKLIDLDENLGNKEFISRHDVIFNEKTGLDMYNPAKIPKKQKSDEEIIHKKNNLAMMFMIIVSTIIIIGAYLAFSNYKPPDTFKSNIPKESIEMLTEEYFFITSIEEFLTETNQNVEKERILIDNYVSGTATKEDTIKNLNIVLKTKENLKVLYDKITPIKDEVVETKRLSDKIFKNTTGITSDILSSINNNKSKVQVVESFNNYVDLNNSNIYMYNQYVQSVFRRYNISVNIDGDKFILDTSWLTNNK